MTNKEKREEIYQIWKEQGIKRIITQEMADQAGVSRQTLYKWRDSPIVDKQGIRYDNWDARYTAEKNETKRNLDLEIQNKLENSNGLVDVIWEQMLRKYAIKIFDDKYTPTLEELAEYANLKEKIQSVNNGVNQSNSDNNKSSGVLPKGRFRLSAPIKRGEQSG